MLSVLFIVLTKEMIRITENVECPQGTNNETCNSELPEYSSFVVENTGTDKGGRYLGSVTPDRGEASCDVGIVGSSINVITDVEDCCELDIVTVPDDTTREVSIHRFPQVIDEGIFILLIYNADI